MEKYFAFLTKPFKSNYLFRGPKWIWDNKEYLYEELKVAMRLEALENGVDLPDDFFLVDFNLLQISPDDKEDERGNVNYSFLTGSLSFCFHTFSYS